MKTLSVLLISAMMLAACGRKDEKTNGAAGNVGAQGSTVATFKYYKGGFYAPENTPNWTNDMTITFTTTGFFTEGRHADPLCTRGGTFTQAQATELFNLVSQLVVSVKGSGGPVTADAGVEYIEIHTNDGQVRKYHLMNMEVPIGEMYATNPTALHDYLQALEAGLPTACQ